MIVLASASPRRHQLLAAAGVPFEVRPADVDEAELPGEDPVAYVLRVSRDKARAVPGDRVLAADTTVVLDGRILGKPGTPERAKAMLRDLSGRVHLVHTGVVLREGALLRELVCTTRVSFRRLSARDLEWYVGTGEPLDRAGSYAIQGHGAMLVHRVHGSYTNVMGLPLQETLELLR